MKLLDSCTGVSSLEMCFLLLLTLINDARKELLFYVRSSDELKDLVLNFKQILYFYLEMMDP